MLVLGKITNSSMANIAKLNGENKSAIFEKIKEVLAKKSLIC
jgi:hypothetical protein